MLDTLFENFDNIVILDTETTGIDFRREEIIELAALRAVKDGDELRIADEMDVFIKLPTGRKIPELITRLTGITDNILDEQGIEKSEACSRFAEFLTEPNTLLIAYNAQFDLCFLYYFLSAFGNAGLLKSVKMLDALTVYKDRRDYPHKLQNAVDAYSLKTQNTHRAIDDTKATLELMIAMDNERSDLEHYINLFGFNPKYGVPRPKISSVTYRPQSYYRSSLLYEAAPAL